MVFVVDEEGGLGDALLPRFVTAHGDDLVAQQRHEGHPITEIHGGEVGDLALGQADEG